MRTWAKTGWELVLGAIHSLVAATAVAGGLLGLFAGLTGCRDSVLTVRANGQAALTVTIASFRQDKIPKKFTCDGEETSPALKWSAPPPGTKSFALVVTDPDAPGGTFVHWVLYGMPADKRELPEGLSKEGRLIDGSRQGRNDFDEIGYRGPCPPGRAIHHYVFTLYALDAKLDLPAGQTRIQVEAAMKGHVLASGELTARYEP